MSKFYPVPTRTQTMRWDPKEGKLMPCEPFTERGQYYNPQRQAKKAEQGKYAATLRRVPPPRSA